MPMAWSPHYRNAGPVPIGEVVRFQKGRGKMNHVELPVPPVDDEEEDELEQVETRLEKLVVGQVQEMLAVVGEELPKSPIRMIAVTEAYLSASRDVLTQLKAPRRILSRKRVCADRVVGRGDVPVGRRLCSRRTWPRRPA